MLRDIGKKHLTGMVLDQAIGFVEAGFTPEDYQTIVAKLKVNFASHPKIHWSEDQN